MIAVISRAPTSKFTSANGPGFDVVRSRCGSRTPTFASGSGCSPARRPTVLRYGSHVDVARFAPVVAMLITRCFPRRSRETPHSMVKRNNRSRSW